MKKLLLGMGMALMSVGAFAQDYDHLEFIPEKNLMEAEIGETVTVTVRFVHNSDSLYNGLEADIWLPEGLEIAKTGSARTGRYFVPVEGGDFAMTDGIYIFNTGESYMSDKQNIYGGDQTQFYKLLVTPNTSFIPYDIYFPYDEEMLDMFTFKVRKKADFDADVCYIWARKTSLTCQVESIANKGTDDEVVTPYRDSEGKVIVRNCNLKDSKYFAYRIGETGYSTLCLNHDLDFATLEEQGVTANTVSATDDGYVTVEKITKPAAGTPLLIKGDAKCYEIKANYNEAETAGTNLLQGTPDEAITVTGNNTYALASKEKDGANVIGFYQVKEGVVIPQYKAFINSTANVEGFIFEETTGISQVVAKSNADNSIYTLTGAKVDAPTQKGVYIQNGKKVVVK